MSGAVCSVLCSISACSLILAVPRVTGGVGVECVVYRIVLIAGLSLSSRVEQGRSLITRSAQSQSPVRLRFGVDGLLGLSGSATRTPTQQQPCSQSSLNALTQKPFSFCFFSAILSTLKQAQLCFLAQRFSL